MQKQGQTRRQFLRSSVILPAAVAAAPASVAAASQGKEGPLPMRKLGKNGPMVTMLGIGGMMSAHNAQYLDLAWNMGIRYFDTASSYKQGNSEKEIGKWARKYPERRKDVFIVTKDKPYRNPEQLLTLIDDRLENIGIDYVDMFFLHGLSPRYGDKSLDSLDWPKSDRLKNVFGQLKDSGKVKYCGFSCHDRLLVDYLNAAAEGGFVDAIMLRYDPLMPKGSDLDKALDACHKAGIGLVSMKEMQPFSNSPRTHPGIESTGLTTHQNVLQTVWSDSRIATICSAMENVQHLQENTMAGRLFKQPVPKETVKALGEIAGLGTAPMCPGCPGCESWTRKTEYAFQDISRYVTYYEGQGNVEARDYFRKLNPRQRDSSAIDLTKIKEACQYHVDYPEIARRSEAYFA